MLNTSNRNTAVIARILPLKALNSPAKFSCFILPVILLNHHIPFCVPSHFVRPRLLFPYMRNQAVCIAKFQMFVACVFLVIVYPDNPYVVVWIDFAAAMLTNHYDHLLAFLISIYGATSYKRKTHHLRLISPSKQIQNYA